MRIFIAFPKNEYEIAQELSEKIDKYNIESQMGSYEPALEDFKFHFLLENTQNSDLVLLFLYEKYLKNLEKKYTFQKELIEKLNSRNISVVPVYIGPKSKYIFLDRPKIFSFSSEKNLNDGIEKIVNYVSNFPKIRFDGFSYYDFENLVFELIKKLNFVNIKRETIYSGLTMDMSAETYFLDPFGTYKTQRWFFEIKFSTKERIDISSIQKMLFQIETTKPITNGVFITNGQITSAVREFVEENQKNNYYSLTIVDGTRLREMILKYPTLIQKFFSQKQ